MRTLRVCSVGAYPRKGHRKAQIEPDRGGDVRLPLWSPLQAELALSLLPPKCRRRAGLFGSDICLQPADIFGQAAEKFIQKSLQALNRLLLLFTMFCRSAPE